MKDEAARPTTEMDVLKFYIWLMLIMTLVLAGFLWKFWNDVEDTKASLALGQRLMSEGKDTFPKMQTEIQGMLNVHKNNKEDDAREQPNTWFATVWRKRGINDASIIPGAWKSAAYNAKGKFYEEQIEYGFNPKAPLPRQSIAEFCHEIEKSSTRMRVVELQVRRTDKENFDKDEWAGKVVVGYRHAGKE